ncbi:MAG: YceI family protein [Verrucomicrobiota bacterium]
MKTTLLVPAVSLIACSVLLTNCAENPADNVPSAEVTEETTTVTETPAAAPDAEAVSYTFTDDSKIGFVGSKVTGSHEGGFEKFSGTFNVAEGKPGAGPHTIEIDMTSTWSDSDKLTKHLLSEDFFEVEKFPTSSFNLTQATPADAPDKYNLSGDVTLHGVTKQISFPATIKEGPDGNVTLDAEFSINRKDFGIVFPGMPDDLIRDEVVINLAMVAAPAQ